MSLNARTVSILAISKRLPFKQARYPYDCLYHDSYGYRACLNGRRFDIAKIETVLALRDNFGLADLNIKAEDVERFESCIYWYKEKDFIVQSLFQNMFRDVV